MSDIVLDSSAVLALVHSEQGAGIVSESLSESVISAVNLSEIVGKLITAGMSEDSTREVIQRLQLNVVPFDEELAVDAGLMQPMTRHLGLSLGDRACLSLARSLDLPVMTADRAWGQLSLGVEVQLIR